MGPVGLIVNGRSRVDSHRGVDCGDQGFGANRIGRGIRADSVGSTVDVSLFDAGTRQQHVVTERPMITPALGVDFRRAPHLAHHDNQCLV